MLGGTHIDVAAPQLHRRVSFRNKNQTLEFLEHLRTLVCTQQETDVGIRCFCFGAAHRISDPMVRNAQRPITLWLGKHACTKKTPKMSTHTCLQMHDCKCEYMSALHTHKITQHVHSHTHTNSRTHTRMNEQQQVLNTHAKCRKEAFISQAHLSRTRRCFPPLPTN